MAEEQWKKLPKEMKGELRWNNGWIWQVIYAEVSDDTIVLHPNNKKDVIIKKIIFNQITQIIETTKRFNQPEGFKILLQNCNEEEFKCVDKGTQGVRRWVDNLKHAKQFWKDKEIIEKTDKFVKRKITLERDAKASTSPDPNRARVFFTLWDGEMVGLLVDDTSTFADMYPKLFSSACELGTCSTCRLRHQTSKLWAVDTSGTKRQVGNKELLMDLSRRGDLLFVLEHRQKLLIVHFSDRSYEVLPAPGAITAEEILQLDPIATKLDYIGCFNPGLFMQVENGTELLFQRNDQPFKYEHGKFLARSKAMRNNSCKKSKKETINDLRRAAFLAYCRNQKTNDFTKRELAAQIKKSTNESNTLFFVEDHFSLNDKPFRPRSKCVTGTRIKTREHDMLGEHGCVPRNRDDVFRNKPTPSTRTPGNVSQRPTDHWVTSAVVENCNRLSQPYNETGSTCSSELSAEVEQQCSSEISPEVEQQCSSEISPKVEVECVNPDSFPQCCNDSGTTVTGHKCSSDSSIGVGCVCGNSSRSPQSCNDAKATTVVHHSSSDLLAGTQIQSLLEVGHSGNDIVAIKPRGSVSNPRIVGTDQLEEPAQYCDENSKLTKQIIIPSKVVDCENKLSNRSPEVPGDHNSELPVNFNSEESRYYNSEVTDDYNSEVPGLKKLAVDLETPKKERKESLKRKETTAKDSDALPPERGTSSDAGEDRLQGELTRTTQMDHMDDHSVLANDDITNSLSTHSESEISDAVDIPGFTPGSAGSNANSLQRSFSDSVMLFRNERRQRQKETLSTQFSAGRFLSVSEPDLRCTYTNDSLLNGSFATSVPEELDFIDVVEVYEPEDSSDNSDDDVFPACPKQEEIPTENAAGRKVTRKVGNAVARILAEKHDSEKVSELIEKELSPLLFELLEHGLKKSKTFLSSLFAKSVDVWQVVRAVSAVDETAQRILSKVEGRAVLCFLRANFLQLVCACVREKYLARWFELLHKSHVQEKISKFYESDALLLQMADSPAMEQLKQYLDKLDGLKLKEASRSQETRNDSQSDVIVV